MTLGVDLCILEVKICARAQINTLLCRKNEKLESVKKGIRLWKNLIHIMITTKKAIPFV